VATLLDRSQMIAAGHSENELPKAVDLVAVAVLTSWGPSESVMRNATSQMLVLRWQE